ncbi:MAG: TIGR02757 family protein [Bacteroidales bacterium]
MKRYLDLLADSYNNPAFIELDPISIPHRYSLKEDREIAGFLTAVISWGNRSSILKSANKMLLPMGESPYSFIMEHSESDLQRLEGFVHRTFNFWDLITFIEALKRLYSQEKGLEGIFLKYKSKESLQPAIHHLKREFFSIPHLERSRKHLPDPLSGSAAKRINMFLRWMVRVDSKGVDFGIWRGISPSILSCPLDIHSGTVARRLGLLTRKANDAKAVAQLDKVLREFDPVDPVKYDFALFGEGVSKKLNG